MEDDTLNEFLADLTILCVKHGIGLNGGTPFVMEEEDYRLIYITDYEGDLAFKEA